MGMTAEKYAEELRRAYGDGLRSVVLFGSGATGEYSRRYSDVNILVVLERTDLVFLRKASRATRKWVRRGNPPPLFFTTDWVERSSDTFPLEFLDIRDRHRVLVGVDPFTELSVDPSNLRHELEHELRGKLLRLRTAYIMTGGDRGKVRDLLARAGSTFQVLFLGVLRLTRESTLPPKARAAQVLSRYAGFEPGVFDAIDGLRHGGKLPAAWNSDLYMEQLVAAAEASIAFVERWKDMRHDQLRGRDRRSIKRPGVSERRRAGK